MRRTRCAESESDSVRIRPKTIADGGNLSSHRLLSDTRDRDDDDDDD